MAPNVGRVKDLVQCMGDAIAAFPEDFSVTELLSAEATLFTASAQAVIDRAPEARAACEALVQHMLLSLLEVPLNKKLLN